MGYLRRKKHPWRNGLLIAAAALPALVALLGFAVLPPVARAQLERRLGAALDRPVSVERVRFNPFTLAMTVESLVVREPDGSAVFAGWHRLFLDFELSSLWGDAWKFAAVELDGPHARIVADRDGTLNFSDLMAARAPAGAAGDAGEPAASDAVPPRPRKPVAIGRFMLNGAQLDIRDEGRATPFATTLGPVSLLVRDFRTVSEADAPYTFEAVTESGEKLTWRGGIQAMPFRSRGELTLSDLLLSKYAPYYAGGGLEVADGRLTVHGRYELNLDATQRVIRLLDGAAEVRDLRVIDRASGEPVLELPRADVKGATADGVALTADVRELVAQNGSIKLRRDSDGALNWWKLVGAGGIVADAPRGGSPVDDTPAQRTDAEVPAPAVAQSEHAGAEPAGLAAARPDGPGSLTVGELALRDFTVEVLDETVPGPARFVAERVHVSLKQVSLPASTSWPVQLAFDWQAGGAVRAEGTVALRPLAVDAQVELDAVAAAPFNPYVEQLLNARLADGVISLGGRLTIAPDGVGAPEAAFTGQAWLERFSVVEAEAGEIVGFSDLVVSGLEWSSGPARQVRVAEVNLAGPRVRAVLDSARKLNLAALLKRPSTAAVAQSSPAKLEPVAFRPEAATANPDRCEVARLVVSGGEISFRDESVRPHVEFVIGDLNGTMAGLSSAGADAGAIDLSGRLGGAAVSLAGRVDPRPAGLSFDLTLRGADVDLRWLSPYSARYAGYELASGRLGLTLEARLAGRQLDTATQLTLNDLAFGAASGSAEATTLPVRLGVALLQDADGRIVLDLPLHGSLDDPEFRVGNVVGRALGGLLGKAAASPFALLGSMVGAGGEELGWQDFAPGESELTPEGEAKLEKLAQALRARPGLKLAITGGEPQEADAAVLRARRLESSLQAAWRERVLAADPQAVIAAGAAMPDEERAATVKHLFDRRFPPGTELGTPLPPAPPILAPQIDEDRHWVHKVVDWILNNEDRRLRAFRREQEEIQRRYLEAAKAIVDAGLPLEVMLERLASAEKTNPEELAELARARVAAVRDGLVARGVGLERLTWTDPADPSAGWAATLLAEAAETSRRSASAEPAEPGEAAAEPAPASDAALPARPRVILQLQ